VRIAISDMSVRSFLTSPRLRGEVGAQRRVRGTFREPEPVESPPHPNPLPAGGEREKHAILAA
jgi:ATP-dependent DNA helicase UvrD/PcrA